MVKKNSFYLFLAFLTGNFVAIDSAKAECLPSFDEGKFCEFLGYGSNGNELYGLCIPGPEHDDGAGNCGNNQTEYWADQYYCGNYRGYSTNYFLGDYIEDGDMRLVCGSDGWTWITIAPVCKDETVFNGTFKNCCNGELVGSYYVCDSYDDAYCNPGYEGTFTGRDGDCQLKCESFERFNSLFTCCGVWSDEVGSFTCNNGTTSFECEDGYYGERISRKYINKDTCKACPLPGKTNLYYYENSDITDCYVPGLDNEFGEEAGSMADATGIFYFENDCFYTK